jgi:hypothetical protein
MTASGTREGTGLTNEIVAAYIGCTAEQVRIMRLHKLTCPECTKVGPSYPQIKAFHSPCCKGQKKCAGCGNDIPELGLGHEVGLICGDCYDGPEEARSVLSTERALSPTEDE